MYICTSDWSRSGGKRWKCKRETSKEKSITTAYINTHKGESRKNVWKLTFVYHEAFPTKVNFQVLMPCPSSHHTSTSSVMNLNNDWSSWKVRLLPSYFSAGSLPESNWQCDQQWYSCSLYLDEVNQEHQSPCYPAQPCNTFTAPNCALCPGTP